MTEAIIEAGAWIYKMIITIILAAVVIGIVGSVLVSDLNTRDVQKGLLLDRVLYSPDSIWLNNQGTLVPGIVDENHFTQSWIDTHFQYVQNYGGAKLELWAAGTPGSPLTRAYTPVYINQNTFTNIETQASAGIAGGGLVEQHNYPVLVASNGVGTNGVLVVTIAIPERT